MFSPWMVAFHKGFGVFHRGMSAFGSAFHLKRHPGFHLGHPLAVCFCVLLLCSSCSRSKNLEFSRTDLMLGTVCRITIQASPSERLDGEAVLDAAFSRLSDVEHRISRLLPDSELSLVNAQAGVAPVVVSEDTFDIISTAFDYAKMTDGAFNPAIGPLVSLWGINTESAKVPTEQEIAQALPLLDWRSVELDESVRSVFLPMKGMSLDLGGIGKGYAADEVGAVLREMGVSSALINLGGNILVIGTRMDGQPWRIGLQDPADERGIYFLTLSLADGTIVTSGPYERFFEKDGIIYHHILDSATGRPAATHIESVTMTGASSTSADALSTAVFVLGLDRSVALLEELPGMDAVFLMDDGTIHMTDTLRDDSSRWRTATERYQVVSLECPLEDVLKE